MISHNFSFVLRPDEGKYHWLKNDVPKIKADSQQGQLACPKFSWEMQKHDTLIAQTHVMLAIAELTPKVKRKRTKPRRTLFSSSGTDNYIMMVIAMGSLQSSECRHLFKCKQNKKFYQGSEFLSEWTH